MYLIMVITMDEFKFIYYDVEVFKSDWLFIANRSNHFTIIHNNKDELQKFIHDNKDEWFVGFNNYHYDDYIVEDILGGNNPYDLSKRIIDEEYTPNINVTFNSLDLMQDIESENGKRLSLKKIMGNLGMSIIETSVPFDIKRLLTDDELDETIFYCKNDVLGTMELFKYRKRYFEVKKQLIEEFNLPISYIRLNENGLVSKILQCSWYNEPRDYLCIDYCPDINFDLIPEDIIDFYNSMEQLYRSGYDYKYSISNSGKKGKFEYYFQGVKIIYGLGGLHACSKNKRISDNIIQVDVSSYYPTLMVNYNFYSRAFKKRELYKQIYYKRIKLKQVDKMKSNAYKLVLNKPSGCMRSNMIMKDFHNGNNIVINGQLILTQLIVELKDYIRLLQVNTDSITFKYDSKNLDKILSLIHNFENKFNLKFDIDKIKFLYQKNVNNYFLIKEDGEMKCKGQDFKNYEWHNGIFINNSRSIISKCLVEYYKNNTPIEKTIQDCYDNNEIYRFQLITSYGKTYDKCFIEHCGNFIEQPQKVNRVFATKNYDYGSIYKCKIIDNSSTKKKKNGICINGVWYQKEKMPNAFDHCFVFNDDVSKFDKTLLDLDYYKKLCVDVLEDDYLYGKET